MLVVLAWLLFVQVSGVRPFTSIIGIENALVKAGALGRVPMGNGLVVTAVRPTEPLTVKHKHGSSSGVPDIQDCDGPKELNDVLKRLCMAFVLSGISRAAMHFPEDDRCGALLRNGLRMILETFRF